MLTSNTLTDEYCIQNYKIKRYRFTKEEIGKDSFTCEKCKKYFREGDHPVVYRCEGQSHYYCEGCMAEFEEEVLQFEDETIEEAEKIRKQECIMIMEEWYERFVGINVTFSLVHST